MKITLRTVQEGFGNGKCWAQSRVGVIGNEWVLTTQPLTLSASDVYGVVHSRYSTDEGKSFSPLVYQDNLALPDRVYIDSTPAYHAASGQLLCFGKAVAYQGPNPAHPDHDALPTSYWSSYDKATHAWKPLKQLLDSRGQPMIDTNSGCNQRYDLPDGDILLPVCRRTENPRVRYVQVLRLRYDGENMVVKEMGSEVHADHEPRGLVEPSLTYYHGRYFLTLRSDTKAYLSVSEDGLHYSQPLPWHWDSGQPHPNYNTQQRWVRGGDKLYWVYTRPNGMNDHVFRHRAPLYMAQVDVARLCVLRHTEVAITPERGARMGNFGVTELSENRSLVVTTEWMQPVGCERYGSNNAIYVVDCAWDE